MKLLANENFPAASVAILRSLDYDVASIGEDDPSISDEAVMKIAIEQGRTILTFDRDYGELIFKYGFRPPEGVIYLRTDPYNPTYPAGITHQLISTSGLVLAGTLTVVSEDKVRQRRYI